MLHQAFLPLHVLDDLSYMNKVHQEEVAGWPRRCLPVLIHPLARHICKLTLTFFIPPLVMQVGSIVVTGAGAVALTYGTFPQWNFFVGGVAVYMGTIVLEAVSMSLTSKVSHALPCAKHIIITLCDCAKTSGSEATNLPAAAKLQAFLPYTWERVGAHKPYVLLKQQPQYGYYGEIQA